VIRFNSVRAQPVALNLRPTCVALRPGARHSGPLIAAVDTPEAPCGERKTKD